MTATRSAVAPPHENPTRWIGSATCSATASIGQAHRSGGLFVFKPKFFDFPTFWLNTPGTYYWQAHRIACDDGGTSDCRQEGPVVRFRVR